MTPKTCLPLVLLLVNCATDSAPPELPDAAPDASPDAPAACNSLVAPNLDIAELRLDQVAPVPAGGTINPGGYFLTAFTTYTGVGGATGPTGHTMRAVTVNDGTLYEFLQIDVANGIESITRTSGTYSSTGDRATINNDCPGGDPTEFGLTATTSTFILFTQDGGGVHAFEFTRQ